METLEIVYLFIKSFAEKYNKNLADIMVNIYENGNERKISIYLFSGNCNEGEIELLESIELPYKLVKNNKSKKQKVSKNPNNSSKLTLCGFPVEIIDDIPKKQTESKQWEKGNITITNVHDVGWQPYTKKNQESYFIVWIVIITIPQKNGKSLQNTLKTTISNQS